jgi:hypothetical protein
MSEVALPGQRDQRSSSKENSNEMEILQIKDTLHFELQRQRNGQINKRQICNNYSKVS